MDSFREAGLPTSTDNDENHSSETFYCMSAFDHLIFVD